MEQIEDIIEQQKNMAVPRADSQIVWDSFSSMALNNITVSNEESEKTLLQDIHFSWKGNGTIGIIGESGAGKSTFIDVLAGFLQPDHGSIVINGTETKSFTREDWLQNIAYIPQTPYVFPLSLGDNIRFYEPSATDEEVERVIDEVDLRSLAESLPEGIHERIGEGGRMLSGGQEQRVAMARALLSKNPLFYWMNRRLILILRQNLRSKRDASFISREACIPCNAPSPLDETNGSYSCSRKRKACRTRNV